MRALDSVAAAKTPAASDTVRPVVSPIRTRLLKTIGGFGALVIVTCLVAPLIGSSPISLARVFDRSMPFNENVDAQIFFVARMPRVLAGAVVGAALAAAGVVFQALLRNALATPFTLGVSAGASLGAILAIVFGATASALSFSAVPLASLGGAVLAAAIVYRLATMQDRAMSTTVLLLAGVTLNSFFSAVIIFVQYIADFAQVYRATRWLMGDLDVGGFEPIAAALPMMLVAFAMFAWLPSSLNVLSVGAEAASARGVEVGRTQRLAFASASLATASAVSLAGPIGFIGIVVPHLVRLVVGSDHRVLLPASTLFGAAFLVICDLIARTAMAPIELPVGIVTAIIGGPLFLWLLVRRS
jgi:iron complex transport system permease protein